VATYTVIQDIEAEDKFVGPLTLKQFIFGAGAALFGYLNVVVVSKHLPFLLLVFVPPMLLGAFLAIPWSKHQSTEVWVLAKLRYYFKPRKRIWNQAGLQELVTVTAPKKVIHQFTNNLSETEVTSRLQALAKTIDTRGWAIKNATLADSLSNVTSDRLVGPTILPEQIPAFAQDIPDNEEGTVAANFDHMIEASAEIHKNQTLDKMNRVRAGEPLESITKPEIRFTPPPAVAPIVSTPPLSAVDEQALSAKLKQQSSLGSNVTSHLRRIGGHSGTPPIITPPATDDDNDNKKAQATMTATSRADIIDLSRNDDLSVATIARQAKRDLDSDNEVVISLR
jgi:hypothetical protein